MININYKKYNKIFINTIDGELSIKTIDEFNTFLQIQFDLKPEIIALNCSNLNYLDSTGINQLVKLEIKASEKDIKIIYLDLPDDMKKMFNLTHLSKICQISSNENFEADYMYYYR